VGREAALPSALSTTSLVFFTEASEAKNVRLVETRLGMHCCGNKAVVKAAMRRIVEPDFDGVPCSLYATNIEPEHCS
jgi:hypothetical protein